MGLHWGRLQPYLQTLDKAVKTVFVVHALCPYTTQHHEQQQKAAKSNPCNPRQFSAKVFATVDLVRVTRFAKKNILVNIVLIRKQ